MENISRLHRILFWLGIVPGGVFALGYYLAPVAFNEMLGVETPDPVAIRSLGGLLIASAAGAALALRSGKWHEVRLFSIYQMIFNLLNGFALARHLFVTGDMALVPNVTLLLLLGFGFAFVLWQRRNTQVQESLVAGRG